MGSENILCNQVIIQPRDRLLFRRLCDFGYLSTNEIANWVYKAGKATTAVRLWKLKTAGYLASIPRKSVHGESLFRLSFKKARAHLSDEEAQRGRRSCSASTWRRSHFKHEEVARNVSLRILALFPEVSIDLDHLINPITWMGQFDRKASSSKVPDFVLNIDDDGIGVFEIELTQKSHMRYFRVFHRLIENARCPIIYLCGSKTIKDCVEAEYHRIAAYMKTKGYSRCRTFFARELKEIQDDNNLRLLIEEILKDEDNQHLKQSPKGVLEVQSR